jgi:hypothetical protein
VGYDVAAGDRGIMCRMALHSEITAARAAADSRERETPAPIDDPTSGNAPGIAALLALAKLIGQRPPAVRQAGAAGRQLDRLRAGRELHELVDQLTEQAVADALRTGARFEDVGDALGLSRSAAHRRFGHVNPRPYTRW